MAKRCPGGGVTGASPGRFVSQQYQPELGQALPQPPKQSENMVPTFEEEYRALTGGAGLVDFSHRTRLEVKGDDRASFLHNLSTNDVKKLAGGAGCETFLLDARGHVLGHGFLICRRESIVIETVAGQGPTLLKHLNRYLIREKVELHDRTDEWGELLVAGAESQTILASLSSGDLPTALLQSADVEIAGQPVTVVRVAMTEAGGNLLMFARESHAAVRQALESKRAVVCGDAALEAARIEAGFPYYGRDITDKNLPQEVGRDKLAISFTKGCYIGQETVARIDALGHVNKSLVKLRFDGAQVVSPGTELLLAEQIVGQVTSAAFSPRLGAVVALAYLRRVCHQPGSELTSAAGQAVVTLDFAF